MAILMAITYPDREQANRAMEAVGWLDFDHQIDVKAASWVTKENGNLEVHNRRNAHLLKKTAGGTLGLVVGGIFGLPVVGLAAGIATLGHRAKRNDLHIDDAFIASVGSALDEGGSAIFILWDE